MSKNLRDRNLLDMAYKFPCLLQIPGVCTGGTGEPCHANWAWAGKGGAMKAHDCFAVPGCRACHMALDQGNQLSGEAREGYWLRAFGRYLPALIQRGLLIVGDFNDILQSRPPESRTVPAVGVYEVPTESNKNAFVPRPERKRRSACQRSMKTCPRPKGGFAP